MSFALKLCFPFAARDRRHEKDTQLLEQGQRRATRIIKGLERFSYGARLREFELFRLGRLPRESVDAPSLEVLKARLDGALGSLSW